MTPRPALPRLATTLPDAFRSARFELRMRVASAPRLRPLYGLVVQWGRHKVRQAGDVAPREAEVLADTELVIDGYQGSANSFLTRAFKHAQDRPVRLAHHLHAPAAVVRAVELGVPTVVTIREPRGAVLSLVSRWPYVSVAQALRGYARYYEAVEPVVGDVVLSPFPTTTRHPGRTIQAVNDRFGTRFGVFEPVEANLRAVREPSAQKEAAAAARDRVKAARAVDLHAPEARRLLDEAQAVHTRLVRQAVPPPPTLVLVP